MKPLAGGGGEPGVLPGAGAGLSGCGQDPSPDQMPKLCPPGPGPKAMRGGSFCRKRLPASLPMWAAPWDFT